MTGRILVVDDNSSNRRLMQAKLEARYYDVTLAEDGQTALRLAVSERPEIVLLDVMMPGMDGYEVCKRLKANPATSHLPVIMLTALNDVEHRIRGLKSGADDFLSKPIDDFALMSRLDTMVRYTAVAHELRQRHATVEQGPVLTEDEVRALTRPAGILVIDRNELVAESLTQTLKGAGYAVASWHKNQNAIADKLNRFDMVILALSDQSYDPLKLCAHLCSRELRFNPSILVSYEPEDRDRALRALELGAGDLIQAPVNSEELLVRVKTQLKRARYVETLRKRVDRGLELSVIDQLTGLFNRRHMLSQLSTWMRRASRPDADLSVAVFDIDHFKQVNDDLGHESGDEILKRIAQLISENTRPKDVTCRMGGEEFIVIMPETSETDAVVCAERIREAIAAYPFKAPRTGASMSMTVSAGVACAERTGDTVRDILHRADQALYFAKNNGRNRTANKAA